MSAGIEVGQVYEDRDYANAVDILGPWITTDDGACYAHVVGIEMRQVKVLRVGDGVTLTAGRVHVMQVKGKNPGRLTTMSVARLLGQSRSQGFDLITPEQ